MAAIEYGSYYWGIILNGLEFNVQGETVYLHADEMKIDSSGTLIFLSAGRRPAGAWPSENNTDNGKQAGNDAKGGGADASGSGGEEKNADGGKGKDDKEKQGGNEQKNGMIHMAFASGTWRTVFAAKLNDGAPACVEHWTAFGGKPMLETIVSPDAAAKMA